MASVSLNAKAAVLPGESEDEVGTDKFLCHPVGMALSVGEGEILLTSEFLVLCSEF